MASLSALSAGNLIAVTPQNVNKYTPTPTLIFGFTVPNSPSLTFHYETENAITLKSDITDHYVEDNTAIQDQIALPPEVINVKGFIGELNDVAPKPLQYLQTAANKLLIISDFTPRLSVTALNLYNSAFSIYQTTFSILNSAISAYNLGGELATIGSEGVTTKGTSQNRQQTMFTQFYGYWRTKTLFTVQTPWAQFTNCAIESLIAHQGEDTTQITDFEINFKVMRFASIGITSFTAQGRLDAQSALIADLGVTNLLQSSIAFASIAAAALLLVV